MTEASANGKLLSVKDLRTYFETEDGTVKAVDGVSFEVKPAETLGIVGESGSGKSVANLSILRLIPAPAGKIVSGSIEFQGRDILKLSPREIEILDLVARGNSNKIIGRKLTISDQTVKNHVSAILRKLEVNDRTEAVVYALRNGWIRIEAHTG